MANYFDQLIARDAQIQGFFQDAQTEQAEATSARKDFAAVAERTTLEEIEALREHSQDQARNAAETASSLDGLSQASQALHERQTSILANELEPLMRLVDPENSIQGLTSRVQNARTQLAVTQSRAELQQRSFQVGQAQRAKEIDLARLRAANQQEDVADIQRLIALNQGAQNQAVFTASQLQRGTVSQMRQAVSAGLMTEEDMNAELVKRDMRGLNVKAAHRADFLQTLETMSVPELKARAEQKPNEAETILRVIQRKENQSMAHEVAMRSGMLARYENESPENIRAAVERGDLLPGEALNIARQQSTQRIAFENLVQAQKDAELARGAQNQKLIEQNRQQWLATAPMSTLEQMNTEAIEGDGVTVIPGTNVKVTAQEIQQRMQGHATAMAHDAMTSAAINASRQGIAATAEQSASILGLPIAKGQDPMAVYEMILDDPTVPANVKTNIRSVVALTGQLNTTTQSPTIHASVLARADELLAQSKEQLATVRQAGMSPAMKAAHTQFVEQNRTITNRDLATNVIGEQVFQPSITTGKPLMDMALRGVQTAAQGLMTPPKSISQADARSGETLDVLNFSRQQEQAEAYAKHPERAVSAVLRDPGTRQQILRNIANETRFQLYRQVWEAQGDEQMLAMASNPNSQLYVIDEATGKPAFDEAAMANFYRGRAQVPGKDWATFSQAVRELAPKYIETQLQPDGPEAVTVASLNQILFSNQALPVISNAISTQLHSITALATGEVAAENGGGVAPPADFPVRVGFNQPNRPSLLERAELNRQTRDIEGTGTAAPIVKPGASPSEALQSLLSIFTRG